MSHYQTAPVAVRELQEGYPNDENSFDTTRFPDQDFSRYCGGERGACRSGYCGSTCPGLGCGRAGLVRSPRGGVLL